MWWWVTGVIAWLVISVSMAYLVGRGIHLGHRPRHARRVPSQRRPSQRERTGT